MRFVLHVEGAEPAGLTRDAYGDPMGGLAFDRPPGRRATCDN